ncbi:MAG TPA: hypothetical protein VKR56_00270 [Candidatus Cybelea sp.]|nr:hypothetical protein [Candidatus Cybelea sp.]
MLGAGDYESQSRQVRAFIQRQSAKLLALAKTRTRTMTNDEREALLRELMESVDRVEHGAERAFAKIPAGPDRDAAGKDMAKIRAIAKRLRAEFK